MAGEWRKEQNRAQGKIHRHEAVEQSYMNEGVQILESDAKCTAIVRQGATARKAPLARLPSIELHLARWRNPGHLPPTV
jgi:hypothetical protein